MGWFRQFSAAGFATLRRPGVSMVLKCTVSFGLVAVLVWNMDLAELAAVLSSARLSYVAVGIGLLVSTQLLSVVRWSLLARSLGFRMRFRTFAAVYWIGMFFNLFAPSIVGGDVGRVVYLANASNEDAAAAAGGRTGTALSSVVADRVIGMGVLTWIGAMALLMFPFYSWPLPVRYSFFALALGVLVGWLLLSHFGLLVRRLFRPFGDSVAHAMDVYRHEPRLMLQTVLLSVLIHLAIAAIYVMIGFALELHVPYSYSLTAYPLVALASALPITLFGIGIREAGFLYVLGRIHIPSEQAIVFGLLWLVTVLAVHLCGGVVFIFFKLRRG